MSNRTVPVPAPVASPAAHSLLISPKDARQLLRYVHQARGALLVWAEFLGPEPQITVTHASSLQITAASISNVIEAAESLQGVHVFPDLFLMYARHGVGQIDECLWNFIEGESQSLPPTSALRATAEMAGDQIEAFLVEHGPALERHAALGAPCAVVAH